jgi:hypothetical protein
MHKLKGSFESGSTDITISGRVIVMTEDETVTVASRVKRKKTPEAKEH